MSISINLKYAKNGSLNIVYTTNEINDIVLNIIALNHDYLINRDNIVFWKTNNDNNYFLIFDNNFNEMNKILQLFDLSFNHSSQSLEFNLKGDAQGSIYNTSSVLNYIGYTGDILTDNLGILYVLTSYDLKYLQNSDLVISNGVFGIASAQLKNITNTDNNLTINVTNSNIEIDLNNNLTINNLTANNNVYCDYVLNQQIKGSYFENDNDPNSFYPNSLVTYYLDVNQNLITILNNQTNKNKVLGVYKGINNNKSIIQNTGICEIETDIINFVISDYNNGDYVMIATSDNSKIMPHNGNNLNDVIGIILKKVYNFYNITTGQNETYSKSLIKLI